MTNSPEMITFTLPENAAVDLMEKLRVEGVRVQKVTALRQAGGGELVTVILPITLTAVQVAATFLSVYLAARLAKKEDETGKVSKPAEPDDIVPKIEIKIGRVYIAEANFSVSGVEETIGRSLSDD